MVGILLHELHLVAHLLHRTEVGGMASGHRLLPLRHAPVYERDAEEPGHGEKPSGGGERDERKQLLREPRLRAGLRPVRRGNVERVSFGGPEGDALHPAKRGQPIAGAVRVIAVRAAYHHDAHRRKLVEPIDEDAVDRGLHEHHDLGSLHRRIGAYERQRHLAEKVIGIGYPAEAAKERRHLVVEHHHVPAVVAIHQHDLAARNGLPIRVYLRPARTEPAERRDVGAEHPYLGLVEGIPDLGSLRLRQGGKHGHHAAFRLQHGLHAGHWLLVRKWRHLADLLGRGLIQAVAIFRGDARHLHEQGGKRHGQHNLVRPEAAPRRPESLHEIPVAVMRLARRIVADAAWLRRATVFGRRGVCGSVRAVRAPEAAVGDTPFRLVPHEADAAYAIRLDAEDCDRLLHLLNRRFNRRFASLNS